PRRPGLPKTRPPGPRRPRQGPRGPRTASVVSLSPRAGPALLSGSLADPAGCVPLRGARREGTCVLQQDPLRYPGSAGEPGRIQGGRRSPLPNRPRSEGARGRLPCKTVRDLRDVEARPPCPGTVVRRGPECMGPPRPLLCEGRAGRPPVAGAGRTGSGRGLPPREQGRPPGTGRSAVRRPAQADCRVLRRFGLDRPPIRADGRDRDALLGDRRPRDARSEGREVERTRCAVVCVVAGAEDSAAVRAAKAAKAHLDYRVQFVQPDVEGTRRIRDRINAATRHVSATAVRALIPLRTVLEELPNQSILAGFGPRTLDATLGKILKDWGVMCPLLDLARSQPLPRPLLRAAAIALGLP